MTTEREAIGALTSQIRAIGVNLNQAVRAMNAGHMPEGGLLRGALTGLSEALREANVLYGSLCQTSLEERMRRLAALDATIAVALAAVDPAPAAQSRGADAAKSGATRGQGRASPSSEIIQARLTPPVEVVGEEEPRRARGGGGGGANAAPGLAAGARASSGSREGRPEAAASVGLPARAPLVVKAGLAAGSQVAVVKLASYASGRASMGALVNYQSRDGVLPLEREDGTKVEGKAALSGLVAAWANETNSQEPSKDSLALEFRISDPASEAEIAEGLGKAFAGHRYAWRAEASSEGMTVHVVLSAASSRRDEAGKAERIHANRKSLGRLHDTIKEAFGRATGFGPVQWSHGPEGMTRQMREASLRGALPLATSTGKTINSPEAARDVAQSWKRDLRSHSPRDTAHIIISAKPGTPRDMFVDAARATLAQEFAGHKYAFSLHSDRAHLHVHAIVRMDNAEGKRLHPNIGDFKRWRETMAHQARERHIAMEPSSRFDQALTPAYKLGDVQAMGRGTPTEAQRRRVEARLTRAVHIPTRDEGRARAQANAREWRQLPEQPARALQTEPPVPAGHIRLYRAERADAAVSAAPLYSTTRGSAETLAKQTGGRIIYLDVPPERRDELAPSRRNPAEEFVVSKSLAAHAQNMPPGATILNFRERAEAALSLTLSQAPGGAVEPTQGAQDLRSAAAMTANFYEINKTVAELSEMLPKADREAFHRLGAEFEAKGAQAIAAQRNVEQSRPYAEGPSYDPPTPRALPSALQGFTAELKAGEVRYSQIDEQTNKPVVAFVDAGKTVTIHNWKSEEAVIAAWHVASQKWGTPTLSGSAAFKEQAVQIAAANGYAVGNPELQDQLAAARAQIERQRELSPSLSQGEARPLTPTPEPIQVDSALKTPAEGVLALEQNRVAIEREAVRETRQANEARAQGEVNPAQNSPEAPYRPAAEAASARDAARAVDQSPNQSIPVETTQSHTVRNLSAERDAELSAQRHAEVVQRLSREEAQKIQTQDRGGAQERDDGPER
jgi:Large polyvalent protein-associated domain 7/Relaxase/Mobilisation nuclease domain